jgi:para-nitrobenzyl esterase
MLNSSQVKRLASRPLITAACLLAIVLPASATAADRVRTLNGVIEGSPKQASGVRIFKGIPYAQAPVGDLRWKPPQPVKHWKGVRQALQFGPRCMQHAIYGDMNFHSNGMSEDCLYLNVWSPAQRSNGGLPVLVYFYGGGFVAGDSSEPRYDGESLAARGLVVVSMNYRLGVFGFLAHPELTKESLHGASGNYGLLDQNAALQWVQQNVASFGGDPNRVTIAGESAGSISVSAHMVSPLSKNLIHGAIGESGSMLGALSPVPLAQAEQRGLEFASSVKATSLAALRAMTTEQLQEATGKSGGGRFPLDIDGYFLTEFPASVFAAGQQAHVPLLVGWNSAEKTWRALLGEKEPTPDNYDEAVRKLYADRADEVLKLYPGSTSNEVLESATDLASDRFISYSTWKWFDLQTETGRSPVYRYLFSHPRPPMNAAMGDAVAGLAGGVTKDPDAHAHGVRPDRANGAVHSAEIEYALGNLSTNKVFAWTPEDYNLSNLMQQYFANFVKKGDPNGPGLPLWPSVQSGTPVLVMRLDEESRAEPEKHRERYLFLDHLKMSTAE